MGKRIKETENNKREISKMIENLSTKIDSLTERETNASNRNTCNYVQENIPSTVRIEETENMTRPGSHYINNSENGFYRNFDMTCLIKTMTNYITVHRQA